MLLIYLGKLALRVRIPAPAAPKSAKSRRCQKKQPSQREKRPSQPKKSRLNKKKAVTAFFTTQWPSTAIFQATYLKKMVNSQRTTLHHKTTSSLVHDRYWILSQKTFPVF